MMPPPLSHCGNPPDRVVDQTRPHTNSTATKPKLEMEKIPPIDAESQQGKFGWETVAGINFPHIFRRGKKFVSVQMVEQKLLSKYPSQVPEIIQKRPALISFFITEAEAKLLNEINITHCSSQFGVKGYEANKDLIVDFKEFCDFFRFVQQSYPLVRITENISSNCGGWLQVNNTVVPYVWRQSKKFVPLQVIRYAAGLLADVQVASENITPEECYFFNHVCKEAGLVFVFETSAQLISDESLDICKAKTFELPAENPFKHAEYYEEADTVTSHSTLINPPSLPQAPPIVLPKQNTRVAKPTSAVPTSSAQVTASNGTSWNMHPGYLQAAGHQYPQSNPASSNHMPPSNTTHHNPLAHTVHYMPHSTASNNLPLTQSLPNMSRATSSQSMAPAAPSQPMSSGVTSHQMAPAAPSQPVTTAVPSHQMAPTVPPQRMNSAPAPQQMVPAPSYQQMAPAALQHGLPVAPPNTYPHLNMAMNVPHTAAYPPAHPQGASQQSQRPPSRKRSSPAATASNPSNHGHIPQRNNMVPSPSRLSSPTLPQPMSSPPVTPILQPTDVPYTQTAQPLSPVLSWMKPDVFQGKSISLMHRPLDGNGRVQKVALVEALVKVCFPEVTTEQFLKTLEQTFSILLQDCTRQEELAFIQFYTLPTTFLKCKKVIAIDLFSQYYDKLRSVLCKPTVKIEDTASSSKRRRFKVEGTIDLTEDRGSNVIEID